MTLPLMDPPWAIAVAQDEGRGFDADALHEPERLGYGSASMTVCNRGCFANQ